MNNYQFCSNNLSWTNRDIISAARAPLWWPCYKETLYKCPIQFNGIQGWARHLCQIRCLASRCLKQSFETHPSVAVLYCNEVSVSISIQFNSMSLCLSRCSVAFCVYKDPPIHSMFSFHMPAHVLVIHCSRLWTHFLLIPARYIQSIFRLMRKMRLFKIILFLPPPRHSHPWNVYNRIWSFQFLNSFNSLQFLNCIPYRR